MTKPKTKKKKKRGLFKTQLRFLRGTAFTPLGSERHRPQTVLLQALWAHCSLGGRQKLSTKYFLWSLWKLSQWWDETCKSFLAVGRRRRQLQWQGFCSQGVTALRQSTQFLRLLRGVSRLQEIAQSGIKEHRRTSPESRSWFPSEEWSHKGYHETEEWWGWSCTRFKLISELICSAWGKRYLSFSRVLVQSAIQKLSALGDRRHPITPSRACIWNYLYEDD